MALYTWPWHEDPLRRAEELLRWVAPSLSASTQRSAGVFPPVNIYDDGESYLVRAEIPGINKDALELTVKGDQLTIRGERDVKPEPDASYHRRERDSGQFRRVVTLPQAVDAEKINATYKLGVLEVRLPRKPEAQPRKISVS
jgi:HSP20 family protein